MPNPEIKKYLLATKPLQYLGVTELDRLITFSQILMFEPQQKLLQQGKISTGMYIILEGNAFVTAKMLGKGLTHFATLKSGDFAGETSLIEREPSTITLVAQNPLQCLLITSAYFDMLETLFPDMQHKLMEGIIKIVCERMHETHKKISILMQQSNIADTFIIDNILKVLTPPPKYSTLAAEGIDLNQLRYLGFFNIFTQQEYEELLQHTQLLKTPKKYPLIQQGEKNSACYLILRGAVQANIRQDNKIAKLCILGPLCWFGGISIVCDRETVFSYVACEHSLILKIDAEQLNLLQKNNLSLWYKLYGLLCKSITAADRAADRLFVRLNSETYIK